MESPLVFQIMTPGYISPFGEDFYGIGDQVLCFTINMHVHLTFHENSKDRCELFLENYKHTISFSFDEFTKNVLSIIPPLKNALAANFNWETPELLDLKGLMPTIIGFVSSVTQFTLIDMHHENALYSFFLLAVGTLCSLDLQIEPFSVFIKSDIPTEISAGSAPAHTVCLAAAFVHYIRLRVMKTERLEKNISKSNYKVSRIQQFNMHVFDSREKDIIFKWSCLCETLMPRNIYGVGSAICTYGCLLLFSKGDSKFKPSIKPFVQVQEMEVFIVDTGIKQDKNMRIEALAVFREHFPEILEAIVTIEKIFCDLIVGILAASKTTVGEKDIGELDICDLMGIDHCIQLALELIEPDFSELWNMMRKEGFTSKLFGTGIGVNGSLLVPLPQGMQESSLKSLKNLFQKNKCLFFTTRICVYGPEINNLSFA